MTRNVRSCASLIFFIFVFGVTYLAVGVALVVAFDHLFRVLFPNAVLLSCSVLVFVGAIYLVTEFALARYSKTNPEALPRNAVVHSLVYAINSTNENYRSRRVRNA